jgi:Fe-S-cluster containining protein
VTSTTSQSLTLDETPTEASIAKAAARSAREALRQGADTRSLAAELLGWHAQAVEAVRRRLPLAQELACAPGCAHCCHLKVTVTPLEVIHLASALRADAAVLSRIKRRVKDADKLTRGKTADERLALALPCPLLDDQSRCVAYAARPLSCAGTNSFDAEGCRKTLAKETADPVGHDPVLLRAASAVAAGVTEATFESGRDGRILELVAALKIALDDPEVKSKWQRGEPVFQPAVDAEFAATMMAGR